MWQQNGFMEGEPDLKSSVKELSDLIEQTPEKFRKFREEEILRKPSPEKWSRKEILGHLIDSALNNLRRFTEIQFLPQPYIIQSYDQVNLVIVNDYQHLPLDQLLNLWQALNRQIIHVIEMIPKEKLAYPVNPQYDNKEMKNLGWIIGDYVAHMKHHMKQIFPSA